MVSQIFKRVFLFSSLLIGGLILLLLGVWKMVDEPLNIFMIYMTICSTLVLTGFFGLIYICISEKCKKKYMIFADYTQSEAENIYPEYQTPSAPPIYGDNFQNGIPIEYDTPYAKPTMFSTNSSSPVFK